MDVLSNLTVEIISQYRHISNCHVAHLKRTVLYVNFISIMLGKILGSKLCKISFSPQI